MSIQIRSANLEQADVAGCHAIYGWYVEHSVASFEAEPPTLADLRDRMAACLQHHAWLVATDGDEIAGYAYGGTHRARAAYRFSTEVSVYVAATHQRRGLGRALYEPLLARLRERGYRLALGGITLPNEPSVRLHQAMGFEEIGRFPRVGWKHGAWHDTGWWALPLGDDSPPTEPA